MKRKWKINHHSSGGTREDFGQEVVWDASSRGRWQHSLRYGDDTYAWGPWSKTILQTQWPRCHA